MKIKHILAVAAAATALSACSVADTGPDEMAIRYDGGFSAKSFIECHDPSTLNYGLFNPGDTVYTYPVGQRTFKFSADPGSDSPPLLVSAKGGVELTVSGTVTFTPNFLDCAVLQRFHETLGIKFRAWEEEGWRQLLGIYIKDTTDRAVDNEGLKHEWPLLANDASTKAAWEEAVVDAIPTLVREQAGGDFFTINNVILQKPDLPAELSTEIKNNEAAQLRANTAETDKQAALSFPGGLPAYQAYQQQQAINKAIAEGRIPLLPVPFGSDLNYGVPAPTGG